MFLSSLGGTHTLGRLFGNTSLGYVSSISEGKTDHNPPAYLTYFEREGGVVPHIV